MKLLLAALALFPAHGQVVDKVFVCKYVGKPGFFELLQTGQNPISVSINSLVGPGETVHIGDEFQDKHGKSVVIAFDFGQPEPDISQCPAPNAPPTLPMTTIVAPTVVGATTVAPTTVVATTVPPVVQTTMVPPAPVTTDLVPPEETLPPTGIDRVNRTLLFGLGGALIGMLLGVRRRSIRR